MTTRSIMAVGAHADDIELNIGGTLLKYHDAGYDIIYVMSTNNFSGGWKVKQSDGTAVSRDPAPPHYELMPQRKLEAAAAAKVLGTEPIHWDHPQRHYTRDDGTRAELRYGCELPKGIPENIPTILTAAEDAASVQRVTDLILERQPEAIITHGVAAGNPEHFATALLVGKGYWKAVEQGHKGLLMQWLELGITVHGRLNHVWDSFVDITGYQQRKLDLIGKHACQIAFPENLDLPEWGPACGCGEAEVFAVIAGERRPGPHDSLTWEIVKNTR